MTWPVGERADALAMTCQLFGIVAEKEAALSTMAECHDMTLFGAMKNWYI